MSKEDLTQIQIKLDYQFKNVDLLDQAFTRKSYSEENGGSNNEVLEFGERNGCFHINFFYYSLELPE